jgi:hypothetical protein
MGKKWAAIQAKLNRSADACRDKYREMDDSYIRGRWKDSETEELKRVIREHLHMDPHADMKELGKMVEAEGIKIQWSAISKRLGKRSRLSCFKKWQKMTGLFSPSDHPGGHLNDDEADNPIMPEETATDVKDDENLNSKPNRSVTATHHAPTAGAAAALASSGLNNHINESSSDDDVELYLLSELASYGASRTSDVNWENLRVDNAMERWNEILEDWSASIQDDSLLALPLSEIAQILLDRKTSAQRAAAAAETVEAVDLPPPETLQQPRAEV